MTRSPIRRLTPSDYRIMPWKNGGGSTTELVIEPEGATLSEGFSWRISTAQVPSAGPFSPFCGYDRTLLLLEGRGLRIDFEGHPTALMQGPLEPVSFQGDWPAVGTPLDGPCLDFNVITRRDRCRHRVEILHLATPPRGLIEGDVHYAFCARGRVRFPEADLELAQGELARWEGALPGLPAAASEEAVLVHIGIQLSRS